MRTGGNKEEFIATLMKGLCALLKPSLRRLYGGDCHGRGAGGGVVKGEMQWPSGVGAVKCTGIYREPKPTAQCCCHSSWLAKLIFWLLTLSRFCCKLVLLLHGMYVVACVPSKICISSFVH